jgi:transitional endoplasmic reticulum ATPase
VDKGVVVHVRGILEDGRLHLEAGNGYAFVLEPPDNMQIALDDALLYFEQDNELEAINIAGPPTFIAVVQLVSDEYTLLGLGSATIKVPHNPDVTAAVGNTVEADQRNGVLRVVHEHPLRVRDSDVDLVEAFRTDPEEIADTFEHFAGYGDVVRQAQRLIELQLQRRELLERLGARPIKGVLFTGDPGTGKTMLARIIAKASGADYYQISGPEVVSKWVGESELILRGIFQHAQDRDSAVIVFDEIDAIAGQRDDNSHEASKRLVAELLTQMDGLGSRGNVIVIATTNRPEDIDVALTRPGRFDWHITFPLPTEEERREILETTVARAATPPRPLPHGWVAEQTRGWSAAELTSVYTEASHLAAEDERDYLTVEDYLTGFDRAAANRLSRLSQQRRAQ